MTSTRRQKAKARKSREMDMMSDLDNIDISFGNARVNPLERELANANEGSVNNEDTESNSRFRRNLSQEKEIRDFNNENAIPWQDRLLEFLEVFTKWNKFETSQRNGLNDVIIPRYLKE